MLRRQRKLSVDLSGPRGACEEIAKVARSQRVCSRTCVDIADGVWYSYLSTCLLDQIDVLRASVFRRDVFTIAAVTLGGPLSTCHLHQ